MPNAAFRLEKDDLQPQNETWSSKRCALPPPLSSHTENHAATSVLPQKRRFRRHESARTSPARTSATPAASITSGARREASTAAIGAPGHGRLNHEYMYSYLCKYEYFARHVTTGVAKRVGGTVCEAGTARTSTQTGVRHAAQRPACRRAAACGPCGRCNRCRRGRKFGSCKLNSEGQYAM